MKRAIPSLIGFVRKSKIFFPRFSSLWPGSGGQWAMQNPIRWMYPDLPPFLRTSFTSISIFSCHIVWFRCCQEGSTRMFGTIRANLYNNKNLPIKLIRRCHKTRPHWKCRPWTTTMRVTVTTICREMNRNTPDRAEIRKLIQVKQMNPIQIHPSWTNWSAKDERLVSSNTWVSDSLHLPCPKSS